MIKEKKMRKERGIKMGGQIEMGLGGWDDLEEIGNQRVDGRGTGLVVLYGGISHK